jgi:LmbE family N-acetylglucosaminyl deacetylase
VQGTLFRIFMDWIYISPHLDDAVLSLGGLIWEKARTEVDVSIWTICAGDPPSSKLSSFAVSIHERWGLGSNAVEHRRGEDILACSILGADYYHFDIPDCIYRVSPITGDFLYESENDLWSSIHPDEYDLLVELEKQLEEKFPINANIVCPLGIGDHVDHKLTVEAVTGAFREISKGKNLKIYYYKDFPYVMEKKGKPDLGSLKSRLITISPGGITAWQEAIAAYRSQISTFWNSLEEMETDIQNYYYQTGGIWLGV